MIERTFDPEKIKEIMTHPDIYDWVSDDGSPLAKDYSPIINDNIYYLVCDAGLFIYDRKNAITWEAHTCVFPEWRGKSITYAKDSIQWMFDNTDCKKIIAFIPVFNRRAYAYSIHAGMRQEGISKDSFMKKGDIFDQYILGAS